MIVSFDTIKCGRQIYFFHQETVVVVQTCEIPLFIFFKEAVIVEETFETVILMWPKFFFNFVILQYIQ